MRRAARAAFVAAGVALTTGAHATPFGTSLVTVELGGEMSVARTPQPCRNYAGATPGCFLWRATGLAIADPPGLGYANMFAGARGGRVVAAMPSGVLITDDRGAHWRPARWDGGVGPLTLAFDVRGEFGAAVGANGSLWTTEDRGETWRARRDSTGQTLTDVAVVGRTVVFTDRRGGVWVSPDGGTSLRTLAEGPAAVAPALTVRGGAIWILIDARTSYRADSGGNVERVDPGAGR